MEAAHAEDHRQSHGDTLWRTRAKGVWIVRGRNLAKTVTSHCMVCKIENQKATTQIMSDLPENVQETGLSPWTHIALDFLGPEIVRDHVKKRNNTKVYPILFTCLQTRAIHVNIALGYSTEEFMTAFQDYMAVRGTPSTIYSDAGSQLVKASKMLSEEVDRSAMSWSQVQEAYAKLGIKWTTAPATAQFRNGRMEVLCRQFKRTMYHLAGQGDLNYIEMQTLLRQAASIVNDRPIGYRQFGGAEGELQPITPNMLLLTARCPNPILDLDKLEDYPDKFSRKLKFRERCLQEWWHEWYKAAFDSMILRSKWKQTQRNVCQGDIVLIRDNGKFTAGDYRRGRVLETYPDKDGHVRTALVRLYKSDVRRHSQSYSGEGQVAVRMAVQRLVVLLPVEDQELVDADLKQEVG